jgi:lambda family phage portal protein
MAKPWPSSTHEAGDLRAAKPAPASPPPPKRVRVLTRQYAGAKNTALTGGFSTYSTGSADTELAQSLVSLRSRSRQLMRDAPYAKRARTIVVNNVVGTGVGLQAQVQNTRGELHDRINADIEARWDEWSIANNCHTGGALHFGDLERACLAEVFTTGEAFLRKHQRAFGASKIDFALELIEAERLADEYMSPAANPGGVIGEMRMGVEVDTYGRPMAYWLRERHPGELRTTADHAVRLIRVPADQIIHVRVVDRWPMTRGEPWLHCVLRKLNDMQEYSGSELTAARMGSNYFATLESPNEDPMPAEEQKDGSRQMSIEPGMIDQLAPGEELKFHAPNRPNTAMDPFLRHMLREVAAGIGVSYESLSRDYSQSNYSSSRLALLDDRDLWRVLQQWWARSFREPLHRAWLQAAVGSGALASVPFESFWLDQARYAAVRWKFRGWSWVDPTKEVAAYKEAVRAGFTTTSAVIAATAGGVDIEDVIAERKLELEAFEEAGIKVDTTVAAAAPPAPEGDDEGDDEDDGAATATSGNATKPKDGGPSRVVSIAR